MITQRLHKLVSAIDEPDIRETNNLFEIEGDYTPKAISSKEVEGLFDGISERDHVSLSIAFGERDAVTATSGNLEKLSEITSEWNRQAGAIKAGDAMRVQLRIAKTRYLNQISLYSLEAFASHVSKLSLQEQLQEFDSWSDSGKQTILVSFEMQDFASSSLFAIGSNAQLLVEAEKRNAILDSSKEICHIDFGGAYSFIPEDFTFGPKLPEVLKPIMEKISTILALMFIADRSEIRGDILSYNIRGYKILNDQISYNGDSWKSFKSIFKTYDWIYGGGALSDKVGLVRNLFSIGYNPLTTGQTLEGLFDAARSNFEIYLTKNVARYLDQKSKVESAVSELFSKTLLPIQGLTSSLKGNLTGFFALFVSVVIANATKSGNLEGIFTEQIILLGLVSVGASAIYLVFCITLVWIGIEKLRLSYSRMKTRYTDVLIKTDCDRILNNDEEYNVAIKHGRIEFYATVSVWILLLLFILMILRAGEQLQAGLEANPFLYLRSSDILDWWRKLF